MLRHGTEVIMIKVFWAESWPHLLTVFLHISPADKKVNKQTITTDKLFTTAVQQRPRLASYISLFSRCCFGQDMRIDPELLTQKINVQQINTNREIIEQAISGDYMFIVL